MLKFSSVIVPNSLLKTAQTPLKFNSFTKVDFAITLYLWKPNLTFCFWDQPTVLFGNYK